jgi:hypothetical protein
MGKRSNNFERRKDDLYQTPLKAVAPVIPFLRRDGIETFAEPCAGDGDLIRHLESFGFRCVYSGDISTGQDAFACDHFDASIVTNPPHTRKIMHEMIGHFLATRLPFWLLIDLDWVSNLHAVPHLVHCSDVVIIGRVKWFPDSENGGKENYAWYRLATDHRGATAIHNNRGGQAPRICVDDEIGKLQRSLNAAVRNINKTDYRELDYQTAFVNLIDALRVYLRCDEVLEQEWLREWSITREQYDAAMAETAPLAAWLKKAEGLDINLSLCGILKGDAA